MTKKSYRISQTKLNKAIELLILGEKSYTAIAQEVDISRNTLQKIREDSEVQGIMQERANTDIKVAVNKAATKLIKLMDAKSEMVSLEAVKLVLALNDIQVTEKSEIEHTGHIQFVDDINDPAD